MSMLRGGIVNYKTTVELYDEGIHETTVLQSTFVYIIHVYVH